MKPERRAFAHSILLTLFAIAASPLFAQQTSSNQAPSSAAAAPLPKKADDSSQSKDKEKKQSAEQVLQESTRGTGGAVLGVLPNFRSTNSGDEYKPIPAKAKWLIAYKDSFYYTVYFVSGAFAGLGMVDGNHPQFGQGVEGYAKRYAAAYGDQAIGNVMTEGLFPSLLHEDPRYFRKETGSFRSRLGSALVQILVVRTDSGGRRFNTSEILGNGVAASIGDIYYKDSRNFSSTAENWYMQVATDAFSNVLKEFWPDMKKHLFKKQSPDAQ